MAKHRKGSPWRNTTEISGRLYWDPTHPSPWVFFRTETAYREWARDVRKALPGTKTEMNRNTGWTPIALLQEARRKSPHADQRALAPYPDDEYSAHEEGLAAIASGYGS